MIEHDLRCSTRPDPSYIQFSLVFLALLNQTRKPRFWTGNLLKFGNTFGISLGAKPYHADRVAAYCLRPRWSESNDRDSAIIVGTIERHVG